MTKRYGAGRKLAASAATVAALVGAAGLLAPAATAAAPAGTAPGPILASKTTVKAPIDECFKAIGDNVAPKKDGTCPEGYQPRVNGTYVWSAARSGNYAYFGTNANAPCFAGAVFGGDNPEPHLLEDGQVCEYSEGAGAPYYGDKLGDMRLPQILRVNADTQKTQDITPVGEPLLRNVSGIRSAVANDQVVLFFGLKIASPLDSSTGLVTFAFDPADGRYLGAKLDTTYNSTRNGVVAPDGQMYVAARNAANVSTSSVLKWTGTKADPFQFEKVGSLANDAGYLTTFGNHLVISGWPGLSYPKLAAAIDGPAKIWMSPELKDGGLTAADAGSWKSIFSWDEYDPDPVLSKAIVWGDIKEWRGDLYVGSYNHVGFTSSTSLWDAYGRPDTEAQRLRDMQQSNRPTTIFKISDPGTADQKVTLLYGDKELRVYDKASDSWSYQPNKLGQTPKFGLAGFGNPANVYSWTFQVFQDKLYMATADLSGATAPGANTGQKIFGLSDETTTSLETTVGQTLLDTIGGGDVYRMDDPEKPAVAETINGFGNHAAHGVRVFLPFEDKGFFYAGTANAWNLKTSGRDYGGWGLNKLTPGDMRSPLDTDVPADVLKSMPGAVTP